MAKTRKDIKEVLKDKVTEARNKFGDKASEIIAEDLKIKEWDGKKGLCPFHHEDTPSFIWNGGERNFFHCFGCGKNYSIIDHYMWKYNLYYADAVHKLFQEVGIESKHEQRFSEDYFRNYKFPIEETNTDNKKVLSYLRRRGISKETVDFAGVKQDDHGNIVFEHRDYNGRLVATKYRPSTLVPKGQKAKWWWQEGSNSCPILYGVDKIDITQPLLIVEGHFDRLACIEAGYLNVVSVPNGASGDGWIEFGWEWLEQFDKIIIWSDNDSAGIAMRNECVSRLDSYRCYIVDISEDVFNSLEKATSENKIKESKADANNVLIACGKEKILELIASAKDIPEPDICDLVDCEDFNLHESKIIPTGFKELDRNIHGYVEGTLNIWTGFTGSGKSTTAIQSAIIGGLEAGESIFCYSGELTKGQLKNWVFMPLAGRRHIIEWDNGTEKPKGYTITKQAKDYMEDYYRGRIIIYDNFLDSSPEHILSIMKYIYMKKGIKIFLLDNLMCIDTTDDNEAQKTFIKSLVKFAAMYKVIIHLVAHPRKPNSDGRESSVYDIMGSSSIPNLAHRIFWVSRVNKTKYPDSTHDGEILVYKDRLLGIYNEKAKFKYNHQCRRIYGESESLDIRYQWDIKSNIKYSSDISAKLSINSQPEEYQRIIE